MAIRRRVRARLGAHLRLAIWGAGGLGRNALRYWLPVEKVRFAVDANAALAGQRIGGVEVVSPEAADFSAIDAVVICTSANLKALAALRARGYAGPAYYVYELFLPEGGAELSELQKLAIDIAVTKNDPWLRFLFLKPQVMVNVTFRLGNWAARRPLLLPLYLLLFILHQFYCLITSIQLPLGTPIGPGLLFAHYGTIVFTRRARIGAFFTVYHGCTVGTNDSGEGPEIGDFVYQYAGSHVLGRCRIGDRCRIGANAVALDLTAPPNSTLVGIPAGLATAAADAPAPS